MEMIGTLREMLLAIMTIGESDYQAYHTHQDGIENQPIYWRNHDQESYRQLADSLQDADIGKCRHLLMCNDGCIIGYAYQTYDEGNDGELQHPVGSRHSLRWYRHLGIQEPYAHRLYQHHDNQ